MPLGIAKCKCAIAVESFYEWVDTFVQVKLFPENVFDVIFVLMHVDNKHNLWSDI